MQGFPSLLAPYSRLKSKRTMVTKTRKHRREILIGFIANDVTYILVEVPDIIQKKIHYCKPNMIGNDVLMIFYHLLMLDVVKCA